MAEAKIISLLEERLKHVRAHTDAAFNSVECEISDLRTRVDQMVKRISALEQGEASPVSD